MTMTIIHWPKNEPEIPEAEVTEADDAELTWETLVRLEPGLQILYEDCLAVTAGDNPHFCANGVWYGALKPRLERLVGWGVQHKSRFLGGEDAYALAYRTCYDVLPPCRDCLCF